MAPSGSSSRCGASATTTSCTSRTAAVPTVEFREELFDSDAAQELLASFVDEISRLYPGWLPSRGPSAVAADFVRPHGAFVIAYVDGQPAACGGLKRLDDDRAGEVKRLYVAAGRRRQGLGRGLLGALERIAADLGCAVVRLDTGPNQPDALRLFEAAGYREITDYNGNPYAGYWFEKRLAGPA